MYCAGNLTERTGSLSTGIFMATAFAVAAILLSTFLRKPHPAEQKMRDVLGLCCTHQDRTAHQSDSERLQSRR